MFGSPSHLTSVPDVPSFAFLAAPPWSLPLNQRSQPNKLHLHAISVPAASSVAGGVPTTFVCILKLWIWLRLVLVSHQLLLPASDRLTNCKVGLCCPFFVSTFSPPVSPVAPSSRASKKPKRRMDDFGGLLEAFLVYCLVLTSFFPTAGRISYFISC